MHGRSLERFAPAAAGSLGHAAGPGTRILLPAHILTKAALNSFIQRKGQAHSYYSGHVVVARHTLLLREFTLPTRLYLGIQENFEGRVDDFVTSSPHHGPQGSSAQHPA